MLWLGMRDSTDFQPARNFIHGNKLPEEDFLAKCHRHFSPRFCLGFEALIAIKKDPLRESVFMAGDEGFEPPISGPEPGALPLGQSPLISQLELV